MFRIRKSLSKVLIASSVTLFTIFIFFSIKEFFFRDFCNTPNPIFYETQFAAHGKYHDELFSENSMELFRKLVCEYGYKLVECDISFTKDEVPVLCHDERLMGGVCLRNLTYAETLKINFGKPNSGIFQKITKFEELVYFAKRNNVCIQIDLSFNRYSKKQYDILYRIVEEAGMLNNVIWEVSGRKSFLYLSFLNDNLIYQVDNSWSIDAINKQFRKAQLVVLSTSNPHNVAKYKDVIKYGHKKGFIFKCATINSPALADSLFSIGCDIILTDSLKNNCR